MPSIDTTKGPAVDGKFLRVDGHRYLVKGVSYGTFAPDLTGNYFPPIDRVRGDFARMARSGVNTVRVYTPPPEPVLDEAARQGLRVMVGLPWAQHIAFLADSGGGRAIRRAVVGQVARLAAHPATLLFALGNEIPPSVVRWHGRARVERFLRALYDEAKAIAPDALFTYVNYPPTEYLDTSAFDVCSFNIYLHDEAAFGAYLKRIQHLAGHRPLLVSEVGGDSLRLGEEGQASLVAMQLRTAFTEGTCGAIVFSWTDEWWRGGRAVDDWAFGLVDEQREPKLALPATESAFQGTARGIERERTPAVSVIVCAYNAADTLEECLTSLENLRYPDYEVLLVNDGSTDLTDAIARRHPRVKRIDLPNGGLAAARNIGLLEAGGEIVAYTDADVRVDPDWLTFLVRPFLDSDVVACGGPNVVPEDDPWLAQCVARAPGGPTHVLLDDAIAEHVPGCNMAFRREALLAIDGFDPIFVRAGDDVDVCWRLQARGGQIAFAAAALVWHRHRASIGAYWRQQVGYGEGETWLMHRHPSKFARGRILWEGHIYSPLPVIRSHSTSQIHAGPCGRAAFPSVYRSEAQPLAYLPHTGRWHAAAAMLLVAGAVALLWGSPYGLAPIALGVTALALTMGQCVLHSLRTDVARLPRVRGTGPIASAAILRAVIALLHFLQPLARVRGRLRGWTRPSVDQRRAGRAEGSVATSVASMAGMWRWLVGRPIEMLYWSEQWIDAYEFCGRLARQLRQQRSVRAIDLDDGWWEDRDLSIDAGRGLRLDVQVLVEDHGAKGSLCRVAARPRPMRWLLAALGAVAALLVVGRWSVDWTFWGALLAPLGMGLVVTTAVQAWRAFAKASAAAAAELGMITLDERPRAGIHEPGGLAPSAACGGEGRLRPSAIFQVMPRPRLPGAGLGRDPASTQT